MYNNRRCRIPSQPFSLSLSLSLSLFLSLGNQRDLIKLYLLYKNARIIMRGNLRRRK